MIALWKNIQGTRKIAVEVLIVSVFTLIVYLVAYWISGKVVVAAAAVFVAFAAVAFAAAAFAAAVFVAFAAAAFAAAVFAAAFAAAAFAAAFAAAVAKEHKVRYWKALTIYFLEGLALFCAMKFVVPYLAIGVLIALCLGIILIFAESKLRLWLCANKPPVVVFEEEREEVGYGIFRKSEIVVARSPASEPFCLRLRRRLYSLYIN